jgi:hypothetical protein
MFKSYMEMVYIADFHLLGSCPISNELLSIGLYNSIVCTPPSICVFITGGPRRSSSGGWI